MIETLSKARDLIAERGLSHGSYEKVDGCLCTVGAILRAFSPEGIVRAYDQDEFDRMIKALSNTIDSYGETTPGAGPEVNIYEFNDRSDKDTVLKLFDDTILREAM